MTNGPDAMEPLPPTVSDILADPSRARARYTTTNLSSYRHSRVSPRLLSRLLGGSSPDTPSASFYRLYEFFILDWNVQFRNELEYFCCAHPDWAVSSIPDPSDDADPVRCAVLAVLTQLMCAASTDALRLACPGMHLRSYLIFLSSRHARRFSKRRQTGLSESNHLMRDFTSRMKTVKC